MTAIAFFNNKGGVGKTTLACNFAAYVAGTGSRVLLLDLDPQCNSTQLVLPEDEWASIYEDVNASREKTVLRPLRRIRAGDSGLELSELPVRSSPHFGLDVLPGHPSLSTLEDIFGSSWSEFKGGTPGGARRTGWVRALRDHLQDTYDTIIIDVSPSLGAINRTALIGSDFFITPMAADLFSLYALDNIATWFHAWLTDFERAIGQARPALDETGFADLFPVSLPITEGFVGYTVQQYVTRTSGGDLRNVQAYDAHRAQIPDHAESLVALSRFEADELDLGTVPNMFSMVPLAQTVHKPIAALQPRDGVRGAQVSQQRRYAEQLTQIFATIAERVAPVLPR